MDYVRLEPELRRALTDWVSNQTPYTAMRVMQKAGLAAAVVQTSEDLWRDPQLHARGFPAVDCAHVRLIANRPAQPPQRHRQSGEVFQGVELPLVRERAVGVERVHAEPADQLVVLRIPNRFDLGTTSERRQIRNHFPHAQFAVGVAQFGKQSKEFVT